MQMDLVVRKLREMFSA